MFVSLWKVRYYTLHCLDIQHEDSGNYSCEVNGPHNALLGAVTHYIYVRGTVHVTMTFTCVGNVRTALIRPTSRFTHASCTQELHHKHWPTMTAAAAATMIIMNDKIAYFSVR